MKTMSTLLNWAGTNHDDAARSSSTCEHVALATSNVEANLDVLCCLLHVYSHKGHFTKEVEGTADISELSNICFAD